MKKSFSILKRQQIAKHSPVTLVVKIPLYLELVPSSFFVRKVKSYLSKSLISTSSSFSNVCTHGRDIVESADKGLKVTGQFDFS